MRAYLYVLLVFFSCGPTLKADFYKKINRLLLNEQYSEAREFVERNVELYGKNGLVIYHMDMGMLYHLEGNYSESNRNLHASENRIEDIYTKSLTREAVSFLTSDLSLPYEGEDFEKLMLNAISCLNYIYLGEPDEAMVEVKKADLKLFEIKRRSSSTKFQDAPFIRYLSGMIFENAGEINDAHIAYFNALEAYEKTGANFGVGVPRSLAADVVRTAKMLGFYDRAEAVGKKYSIDAGVLPTRNDGSGEVVFIHHNGVAPYKVEEVFEITVGKGLAFVNSQEVSSSEEKEVQQAMTVAKSALLGHNIIISYPKFKPVLPTVASSYLTVEETGEVVPSEVVENIGSLSVYNLQERMGRIMGKTIARAVVKFLLAMAAKKVGEEAGGEKWGWLTGILAKSAIQAATGAMESADTRSWGTLPFEFRIARIRLREGVYNLAARLVDRNNATLKVKKFPGVQVKSGKMTFIHMRSVL